MTRSAHWESTITAVVEIGKVWQYVRLPTSIQNKSHKPGHTLQLYSVNVQYWPNISKIYSREGENINLGFPLTQNIIKQAKLAVANSGGLQTPPTPQQLTIIDSSRKQVQQAASKLQVFIFIFFIKHFYIFY